MNRREFSAACLGAGTISNVPSLSPEMDAISTFRGGPDEIDHVKQAARQDVFIALANGFAQEIMKQRSLIKEALLHSCHWNGIEQAKEYCEPVNAEQCAKDACQMASIILEAAKKA